MTTYSKETALYDTGAIGDDIQEAGQTAERYITQVDSNGIKVHAQNNPTTNYSLINANGLTVYKGGNDVATFGDTARVGKNNSSRFLINASSLQAYNSSNSKYFEVSSTGMTYGSNTVASTSYADGKASAAQSGAEATAATALAGEVTRATAAEDDAAKKATSYFTDISSGGVFIHKEDATHPQPDASTSNGVKITDQVDIIRGGESVASFGESARIGLENSGNIKISDSEIIGNALDGEVFRIGTADATEERPVRYGLDNSEGVITIEPAPSSTTIHILVSGSDDTKRWTSFAYGTPKDVYLLYYSATDTKVHVVYNGVNDFTFTTINMTDSVFVNKITVQVNLVSEVPAFTFGTRQLESTKAPYSTTIGLENIGSRKYQLVVGRYNEPTTHLFAIGNGTSNDNRNTIFSVDPSGRIYTNNKVQGTSSINIKHTTLDSTSTLTDIDDNEYRNLEVRDNNDYPVGYIENIHIANSTKIGMRLCAVRRNGDNLDSNGIMPWIDANRNFGYTVDAPAAFRTAIGATSSSSFNKQGTRHIVIGGYHVCFGSVSISCTANALSEVQVTLPYTYTSAPLVFTGFAARNTAARSTMGSNGGLALNKIYVGCVSTTARDQTVVWMTIGE